MIHGTTLIMKVPKGSFPSQSSDNGDEASRSFHGQLGSGAHSGVAEGFHRPLSLGTSCCDWLRHCNYQLILSHSAGLSTEIKNLFPVNRMVSWCMAANAGLSFRGRGEGKQKIGILLSKDTDLWRYHPDLNWGVELLQSSALPLGYGTIWSE